jgi:hypothetical protein
VSLWFLVLPAFVVSVHPAPQHASSPAEALRQLQPFIGGVWTADGQLGDGLRYRAERRYEWALDSSYIRITQTLALDDGRAVTEESFVGWDARASAMVIRTFASDGSYAEGTAKPGATQNRWVAEGRTTGAEAGEWRMTTLLIDATAFSVLLEVKAGGKWRSAMTLAYHRRTGAD